jgi:serine/threonine-protein kinase
MTLAAGDRHGPYEITAKLGEGGMGEVYRATDSKLRREVAIKVLPQAFTEDKERLARFEREAQLLAQLHHPNIAAIFGLEESGGERALVMELVDGPTLAERLASGPLAVEEALQIARQIAEALEEAHEKGIVHRDLKPQNVKAPQDGKVKVLDFGLAKALDPRTSAAPGDLARSPTLMNSPTLTAAGTQLGVILGTAAYMAPEQARGGAVDKRADIWAFGVLLYEMLAGERLFAGDSVVDTLSAVMRQEIDLDKLPASTPRRIRELLRRCLERQPRNRLHDIADARLDLDEAIAHPGGDRAPVTSAPTAAKRARSIWAAASAILLLALGGLVVVRPPWLARSAPVTKISRLTWSLPEGVSPAPLEEESPLVAISPDGTTLAAVAVNAHGEQLVYVRRLADLASRPLAGTDGASEPFFSPDGRTLGFFAGGELKKIAVGGGSVVRVAEAPDSRGGNWAPDGTIVYTPQNDAGLLQVSDSGGLPRPLTTPDREQGERTHRWPQVLPGGRAVIYTVGRIDSPDSYDDARIDAVDIATGERKTILRGAGFARYFQPTRALIFGRGGVLYAVPFDLAALAVRGEPKPVLEGAGSDISTGAVHAAMSPDGTLVYLAAESASSESRLGWATAEGVIEPLRVPPRPYRSWSLSPDGSKIAVLLASGLTGELWLADLERGTSTRLTEDESCFDGVFAPDGRSILYSRAAGSGAEFVRRPIVGGAPEVIAAWSNAPTYVRSVSRDGSRLFAEANVAGHRSDIVSVRLAAGSPVESVVSRDEDDYYPAISPDGRWLAYVSQESGRGEVYLQAYPGATGRVQVSTQGGGEPHWSADGPTLFYRAPTGIARVDVEFAPRLRVSAPRLLDRLRLPTRRAFSTYSVAADGRFVIQLPGEGAQRPEFVVILDWAGELRGALSGSAR